MSEVFDLKSAAIILHLIGVVIGAGGAYVSDFLYLKSTKDGSLDVKELRTLRRASKIVWFGLVILFASGIILFSLNPAVYAASSKFLTKMAVVGVLTLNGFLFHFVHMPVLHRTTDGKLFRSKEFLRKGSIIYASGAVSIVSWTSAIVLGFLRSIPYTFAQAFGIYILIVAVAIVGALIQFRFLSKKEKN